MLAEHVRKNSDDATKNHATNEELNHATNEETHNNAQTVSVQALLALSVL